MTPNQCRHAREVLNLSRADLAREADVPLWFVEALEDGAEDRVYVDGFKAEIDKAFRTVPLDFLLTYIAGLESPSASVMREDGAANTPQNPAT
jgi:hypothetical protein